MSWKESRIVPYVGNRGYLVYLDGYKVNGRRERIYFEASKLVIALSE